MKFSEKWLKEWVDTTLDAHQLADKLTMAGLEVESLVLAAPHFTGVVVGKVVQAEKHPKADRLTVCQVDIGGQNLLNIVCGAPNARAGIYVAVAAVGAVLPNGFTIQKAKLRDVVSEGMLCSATELGLSEISEGIIELPEDAPLGKNLRDYLDLDDHIFELNVTPNRGDCLSIAGIARETAALTGCNIPKIFGNANLYSNNQQSTVNVKVEFPEGCAQYAGCIIQGLDPNARTSLQMTQRLQRSGTRAIFPAVDVTNYVLFELGQPLHAFDCDTLQGDIVIRLAHEGETILLLDGQTVNLKPDTLIIADKAGPIAIAGIMGGMRTAVTEKTRNIFLESAWFSPQVIAGKARQYGLSTDAAHRFERGVDPELQIPALRYAADLIAEITHGQLTSSWVHFKEDRYLPTSKTITLRPERVNKILGTSLNADVIEDCCKRLDFKIIKNHPAFSIQVPAYRSDIAIESDLIEEIARVYGYQNIPIQTCQGLFHVQPIAESKIPVQKFREILSARGYHEIISYSFVNPAMQLALYSQAPSSSGELFSETGILPSCLPSSESARSSKSFPLLEGASLELLNPISSEYNQMRKGLWAGLIEAARYNQNRQIDNIALFECGTNFIFFEEQVHEKPVIAGLLTGQKYTLDWTERAREYDFYDMKGDIEALLCTSYVHANHFRFEPSSHPALHPGQSAKIISNDKTLGWAGALHPELAKQWELEYSVFLFELDLTLLCKTQLAVFTKLSKFPSIRRDISFLVDKSITAQNLLNTLYENKQMLHSEDILQNIQIFDQYEGANIAENQKSLALAFLLQHPDRTLVETEVNHFMDAVVKLLQTHFTIHLRQ